MSHVYYSLLQQSGSPVNPPYTNLERHLPSHMSRATTVYYRPSINFFRPLFLPFLTFDLMQGWTKTLCFLINIWSRERLNSPCLIFDIMFENRIAAKTWEILIRWITHLKWVSEGGCPLRRHFFARTVVSSLDLSRGKNGPLRDQHCHIVPKMLINPSKSALFNISHTKSLKKARLLMKFCGNYNAARIAACR